MTQFLPPNLLALFAPRDPILYLAPVDKLPHEKKTTGYSGLGAFLDEFEDPDDTPPPTRVETRDERRERKRREKQEQVAYRLEQDIALWDPSSLPNGTLDPFKTLFIARITPTRHLWRKVGNIATFPLGFGAGTFLQNLPDIYSPEMNYDTSESKLRREFEVHGPIKKIVLVHNTQSGKPRGYAFIEYEHERDMHSAYKHADGKKMDGRRVLVDVERARTVKGWLPRRLGGGLGGTRRGGPDVNVKYSGREDPDRMRGGDRRERSREREKRRRSRSPRAERRERGGGDERRERGVGEDRERKRRRSHSRSRERKLRSRSPRDRRDRERRRERGDRDRGDRRDRRERNGEDYDPDAVRVKTEPEDDYPEYPTYNSQNPPLKDEDKKPQDLPVPPPPPPPPLPPQDGANGAGYERRDEGEIDY